MDNTYLASVGQRSNSSNLPWLVIAEIQQHALMYSMRRGAVLDESGCGCWSNRGNGLGLGNRCNSVHVEKAFLLKSHPRILRTIFFVQAAQVNTRRASETQAIYLLSG